MNKKEFSYKNFVDLLTKHNIEIVTKETYDSQSGWTGEHLYLKDPQGYLNENGSHTETPKLGTIDLSGNGYCFDELYIEKMYNKVVEFYAEKDFDWFKNKINEMRVDKQ